MMDFNYPNDDAMAAIISGMMGAARAAAEDAAQNQKAGASGKTGPGIQNPAKTRDELLKKAAQGVAANAKVLYDAFIAVGFPADAAISLTGSVLGAANHKF
jgi:hypothetical protein